MTSSSRGRPGNTMRRGRIMVGKAINNLILCTHTQASKIIKWEVKVEELNSSHKAMLWRTFFKNCKMSIKTTNRSHSINIMRKRLRTLEMLITLMLKIWRSLWLTKSSSRKKVNNLTSRKRALLLFRETCKHRMINNVLIMSIKTYHKLQPIKILWTLLLILFNNLNPLLFLILYTQTSRLPMAVCPAVSTRRQTCLRMGSKECIHSILCSHPDPTTWEDMVIVGLASIISDNRISSMIVQRKEVKLASFPISWMHTELINCTSETWWSMRSTVRMLSCTCH